MKRGDEAEKLAVFDSSGVVSIDGFERRPAVLGHGHGAVRIRVRAWGKSEGEREQRVVGCSFILPGGARVRGERGEGTVGTAMAPVISLWRQEEGDRKRD